MSDDFINILSGLGCIFTVFCFALAVFMLIAMWKIYEKAGEPGIAAIVPFWNLWVEFKISWGSGAYMFLMLIPFVNFVVAVITMIKLAKAFDQDTGFGIGLIFLPIIFFPILAFSDNIQYIGPN